MDAKASGTPFWSCGITFVMLFIFVTVNILTRPLFGQGTSNATLYGLITDTSGAVMPGQKVIATNVGTNAASTILSGPDGAYTIPNLPPGIYRVEVEASAQGFATFVANGVVLLVAQSTRVNAVMKPGTVTQEATVTAGVPLVDTESLGLRGTVERQFMDQLPLIDHDAHALETIQAGTGLAFPGGLTINGVRPAHNDYELNGMSIQDPLVTHLDTDPGLPSPDAIEEFTVIRNGYSAEYGQNEGGQVLVQTRAGTNQYHGSAFEYVRNRVLDARSYFASNNPPYTRSIFGATFGGPVKKNRIFYFGSYQGELIRSSPNAGVQNIVPTAAERQGDFSALGTPIIDPTTGQPFPGNIIPSNRLNSVTQNLLTALVPLPNGPAGELIYAPPGVSNDNQVVGRVDVLFTTKNRLSGTYFLNRTNNNSNNGLPQVFEAQDEHDQTVSISDSHTFTPKLINSLTLGYGLYDYTQGPSIPGNPTLSTFGTSYYIPPASPQQLSVHVDGDLSIESGSVAVWNRHFLRLNDTANWTVGRHTISFGGGGEHGRFSNTTRFWAAGRFDFAATFSGNDFSDFMLGLPTLFRQHAQANLPEMGQDYNLYFQDHFQVRRDLTLDLGIRYAPTFYQKLLSGENSTFIFGEQSQVFPNAPTGLVFQGDPGVTAYFHGPAWNVFEPRAGFAWAPFGSSKWVVRSAFGIFHEPMMIYSSANTLTPPYGLSVLVNAPPTFQNPYGGGTDPFPFSPPLPTSPASVRDAVVFTSFLPLNPSGEFVPNSKVPTTLQWNLTIQHQLSLNDGIEIGYVGSRTYREVFTNDLNAPIYIPGQSTEGNINARRPLPYLGAFEPFLPEGTANYNALQSTYRHNASHGLTILANYTWSKTLTNGQDEDQDWSAIFDPFNINAGYGPAGSISNKSSMCPLSGSRHGSLMTVELSPRLYMAGQSRV